MLSLFIRSSVVALCLSLCLHASQSFAIHYCSSIENWGCHKGIKVTQKNGRSMELHRRGSVPIMTGHGAYWTCVLNDQFPITIESEGYETITVHHSFDRNIHCYDGKLHSWYAPGSGYDSSCMYDPDFNSCQCNIWGEIDTGQCETMPR